ncbi:MAG: hypothetical protein GY952_15625 [Rhodobacteraceae bacterium]|nr:hypothetical protein [Paracoccaceae bacterium]
MANPLDYPEFFLGFHEDCADFWGEDNDAIIYGVAFNSDTEILKEAIQMLEDSDQRVLGKTLNSAMRDSRIDVISDPCSNDEARNFLRTIKSAHVERMKDPSKPLPSIFGDF